MFMKTEGVKKIDSCINYSVGLSNVHLLTIHNKKSPYKYLPFVPEYPT